MAALKEFAAKMAEDKAFAETFANLTSKDEFLAKAKAEGFALTEEDLTELAKAGKNDLSDDDLENVSGGALSYKVSFACPKCGKKIITTEGCPNCKTGIYACL